MTEVGGHPKQLLRSGIWWLTLAMGQDTRCPLHEGSLHGLVGASPQHGGGMPSVSVQRQRGGVCSPQSHTASSAVLSRVRQSPSRAHVLALDGGSVRVPQKEEHGMGDTVAMCGQPAGQATHPERSLAENNRQTVSDVQPSTPSTPRSKTAGSYGKPLP